MGGAYFARSVIALLARLCDAGDRLSGCALRIPLGSREVRALNNQSHGVRAVPGNRKKDTVLVTRRRAIQLGRGEVLVFCKETLPALETMNEFTQLQ